MKPLKDIGFRVTPSEQSITIFEPYTTFSDEERRELVREALKLWCDGYDEIEIEEFLDKTGL